MANHCEPHRYRIRCVRLHIRRSAGGHEAAQDPATTSLQRRVQGHRQLGIGLITTMTAAGSAVKRTPVVITNLMNDLLPVTSAGNTVSPKRGSRGAARGGGPRRDGFRQSRAPGRFGMDGGRRTGQLRDLPRQGPAMARHFPAGGFRARGARTGRCWPSRLLSGL